MAVNLFGKIKDRANDMRNKMTDSMVNDVKDLRNDEFKAQMQNARKQNDNLSLWDKYKRTGQKIDVPEFDAKIVDLPKADENEKEIKIDRTPKTSVPPSFLPPDRTDLEALAGNGLPIEEELPTTEEPSEPKGTSVNIPREENPEWDLEDLAGNGQRETPKAEPVVEDTDDTVVGEPMFDEPNNEEETDFRKEYPDSPVKTEEESESLKEFLKKENPEMSDEMADRLSKGDVSDLPDTPGSADDTFVGEPEFDESDVVDPEDNPDIPTDEEIENVESGEEETPEKETDEKENEEEPEEEPKEKTRTEQGPINDDSDLIKKGGGVDINEMVDRSQIPHYNYLSFFQ